LVEQLICNQQVGGSSPSTSSICPIKPAWLGFDLVGETEYGGVPEWPKGADCKSVAIRFGGSNPPSSTKNVSPDGGAFLFLQLHRMEIKMDRLSQK
jgi:hypothetical protein